MTLVAIDPGISTGIAIHTSGLPKNLEGFTAKQIIDSIAKNEYIMLVIREPTKLWEILEKHNPDHVIFENFASGGLISKDGQATLRLIGAIEVMCFRLNIPLVLQFPQERYPFIPIARTMLKQLKKTPISHEVDALSHLLLYEDRVARGVQDQITARRRNTYGTVTHGTV